MRDTGGGEAARRGRALVRPPPLPPDRPRLRLTADRTQVAVRWDGGDRMDDTVKGVRDLLHEVAETHHRVYRIVDGEDPDWASWYADWLIDLSELSQLLGATPGRSHLVY